MCIEEEKILSSYNRMKYIFHPPTQLQAGPHYQDISCAVQRQGSRSTVQDIKIRRVRKSSWVCLDDHLGESGSYLRGDCCTILIRARDIS